MAFTSFASIFRTARHTAAEDYPELGDVLEERPNPALANRHVAADDGLCAICNQEPATQEVAGSSVGDRCAQYLFGVPSEQEAPRPEFGQMVYGSQHTAGIMDWLDRKLTPFAPDVGGRWSYDWCRFRRDSHCFFPSHLDPNATRLAGYAVWVPQDRGTCPRTTWDQQKRCPIGQPGPHSGDAHSLTDATVPWSQGGQRGGIIDVHSSHTAATDPYTLAGSWPPEDPHEAGLTCPYCRGKGVGGRMAVAWNGDTCGKCAGKGRIDARMKLGALDQDRDFHWHFTATWSDVRAKAKRIRSDGGVRIINAPGHRSPYIVAEVQGDHHTYQSTILRSMGSKSVAGWECTCAWAHYAWGRSGRWKKFEGRMCSHVLATMYQAQAEEMFGGRVKEVAERPTHMTEPFFYKAPEIQPWRVGAQRSLSTASEQPVDYEAAPISIEARALLEEGCEPQAVLSFLQECGAPSPERILIEALSQPFVARDPADEQHTIIEINGDHAITDSGEAIHLDHLSHPDFDWVSGLDVGPHDDPRHSPEDGTEWAEDHHLSGIRSNLPEDHPSKGHEFEPEEEGSNWCKVCGHDRRVTKHKSSLQMNSADGAVCKHCERPIKQESGSWVDPEATGDDSIWRETCDSNNTSFAAEHEPRRRDVTHIHTGPLELDKLVSTNSLRPRLGAGMDPVEVGDEEAELQGDDDDSNAPGVMSLGMVRWASDLVPEDSEGIEPFSPIDPNTDPDEDEPDPDIYPDENEEYHRQKRQNDPRYSMLRWAAPLSLIHPGFSPEGPANMRATRFTDMSPEDQQQFRSHVETQSPDKSKPLTEDQMVGHVKQHFHDAIARHGETKRYETYAGESSGQGPIEEGKAWYRQAHKDTKRWSRQFGLSHRAMVGVTASLSPRTDWAHNIQTAHYVAQHLGSKTNQSFDVPKEQAWVTKGQKGERRDISHLIGKRFHEMGDEDAADALVAKSRHDDLRSTIAGEPAKSTGEHPKTTWSTGPNILKAVKIARGSHPSDVLSGHKVRSFNNNIADPENHFGNDDVTMDSHAVSAAANHKYATKGPSGAAFKKLFEQSGKGAAGRERNHNVHGTYNYFAHVYRRAHSELHSEGHIDSSVTPSDLQAIVWNEWREKHKRARTNSPRAKTTMLRWSGRGYDWDRHGPAIDHSHICPHAHQSFDDGRRTCKDCGVDLGPAPLEIHKQERKIHRLEMLRWGGSGTYGRSCDTEGMVRWAGVETGGTSDTDDSDEASTPQLDADLDQASQVQKNLREQSDQAQDDFYFNYPKDQKLIEDNHTSIPTYMSFQPTGMKRWAAEETLREEPEPALPSTDGDSGPSETWQREHSGDAQDPISAGPAGFGTPADPGYAHEDLGAPEQDAAVLSPSSGPGAGSLVNETEKQFHSLDYTSSLEGDVAGENSRAWLMSGETKRDAGGDRGISSSDIAAQARLFLETGQVPDTPGQPHQAAKVFTPAEQAELIHEGADGVTASNLDRLQLEGTHYLALEDDPELEGLLD